METLFSLGLAVSVACGGGAQCAPTNSPVVQPARYESVSSRQTDGEFIRKVGVLAEKLSPSVHLNDLKMFNDSQFRHYDPKVSIRVAPGLDRGLDATVQLSIPL